MFLMNDVVLDLDLQQGELPLDASRFRGVTASFVVQLGQELFADHPRLQHTDPEKARRLAMLLVSKTPEMNAALFVSPRLGCQPQEVATRFCNVTLDVMAALRTRQNDGSLNAISADREVWRRLAA